MQTQGHTRISDGWGPRGHRIHMFFGRNSGAHLDFRLVSTCALPSWLASICWMQMQGHTRILDGCVGTPKAQDPYIAGQELRGTLGFQTCFYTCLAIVVRKHLLDANAGAHKDFRWLGTPWAQDPYVFRQELRHTWILDSCLHVLCHRGWQAFAGCKCRGTQGF